LLSYALTNTIHFVSTVNPDFSNVEVARQLMEVVALFAGTALLLAGLGIYGTISFLVHEQSREIAIRLALGAQRSNILRMVLRRGLTLAAAGVGVGLLYGVSPDDLSIFASVTAVAIAASCVPALRAMRVDPVTTLRS
jgi:putative ABC transport system permease protein